MRESAITNRLRFAKQFPLIFAKTNEFYKKKSFIFHSFIHLFCKKQLTERNCTIKLENWLKYNSSNMQLYVDKITSTHRINSKMICCGSWRERELLCTDWVSIFKQHSVNKIAFISFGLAHHQLPVWHLTVICWFFFCVCMYLYIVLIYVIRPLAVTLQ